MTTRPSRITLQNIAQEAGVSASTVSRALNNHARIDPETRARVREVADRLGYRVASGLDRREQNMTLAAIMSWGDSTLAGKMRDSNYGSFGHIEHMLFSIEQTAQEHGYHLILNSDTGIPGVLPSSVRSRVVDGALLIGGVFASQLIEQISVEVPTVLVGSALPGGAVHAVHPDYYASTAQAVDHLVALGHRRIALLNGPPTTNTSNMKLAAYLQRCFVHGLPIDQALVVESANFGIIHGAEAAAQLFKQASFSAIVAATETLAAGAIDAAQARGLEVPHDLSVVSVYNSEGTPVRSTPLSITGAHVSFDRLGQLAAERLLALIAQPAPPITIVLAQEFVIGATSGPAPST